MIIKQEELSIKALKQGRAFLTESLSREVFNHYSLIISGGDF